MDELITCDDLMRWLGGYERPADVERRLRELGVPYWNGKGGLPCTTATAINRALLQEREVQFEP